jgi:uncharacterized protein YjbI with pentapeptide repeats
MQHNSHFNHLIFRFTFLCYFFFLTSGDSLLAQSDDPNTPFNDLQLRLIKKGYKFFAAYQKAYKDKNDTFPKINLQEAPLLGADLRGMNLDYADFREADLRGARFGDKPAKKNIQRDNEGRIISSGASVAASSLQKADFRGADIGENEGIVADLSLTNCAGANFSETDLTGAKFIQTNLQAASLVGSSLIGANFRKADLTAADLSEADVENCTFDRTVLIRTQMKGANLDEAFMKEVILTSKELEAYLEKKQKNDAIYRD